MKKIIVFILPILFFVFLTGCQWSNVYKNEEYGFSMKYDNQLFECINNNEKDYNVLFNYKNGNVSFGIKVEKRQDIDNDDLSKYFSYKLKNGQIIEQSVTIDGYKGRWLSVKSIPEIDEAEKNDDSIMDIIFFTKDEYVYSFYFSAENKMMYDETEPLIDSMLSTINFMEK